MIKLKNVNKKYDKLILNNLNITFENGLIGIIGSSGCGKSTLLNLISLLDNDYEGDIYFNNINYKDIHDKEKFRYENFGFVFQNYQLFNLLNVKDNILMFSKEDINTNNKINEVLKLVHLKVSMEQKVSTLSGGEKQRLAIARSLYKGSKVLICDEPTGALDHTSKQEIMSLLKSLSKQMLVIIVSHEEELINLYCSKIYKIENKNILLIRDSNNKYNYQNQLSLLNKMSLKMMINYILTNLKIKKVRSIISLFSISLGIICLGISFSITNMVKQSVESSLISSFDQDKILITKKEKDTDFNEIYSGELDIYQDLKNKYNDIFNIGSFYFADFEMMLKDRNYFMINFNDYSFPFSELSTRSINDYEILHEEKIYPFKPNKLNNEEFILSLRNKDIKRICQNLHINNSINDLSEYLKNNSLSLTLKQANFDWDYENDLNFKCKYFIVSDELKIYHTSSFFNEDVFENKMHFKTSNDLLSSNYIPWTFKKVYYFEIENYNYLSFLDTLINDKEYYNYYFDLIDKNNSIYLSLDSEYKRIYMTKQTKKRLDINLINQNVNNYYFSNDKTYYVLEDLLLNTFYSSTFLISEEEKLTKLIDDLSYTDVDINSLSFNEDKLVYGNMLNLLNDNNLKFDSEENIKSLYGRSANNYQEIVISKGICDILFPNLKLEEILNKKIYFLSHKNSLIDNLIYHNYFDYVEIKIVGISESKFNVIYGDKMWTSYFYVDNFSYSLSELMPVTCVVNNKNIPSLDNLVIKDPLKQINLKIEEIINYINIVISIFALSTIISSILMNVISMYLFIYENKKEIGLLRAIGISKISLGQLFINFGLIMGLISFIMSSFVLLIINLFLSFELSHSLILFSFINYFKSLLIMFIISILSSLIIGFISLIPAFKGNPIEVLKEK